MKKRDYYDVLGVARDADADALKKAYRRLAMKYHPDRNPDDAEAEENFKEAKEAYDVLKDSEKRAKYDQWGHDWEMGGFNPFGGNRSTTGDANLDEILRRMREADINVGGFREGVENTQRIEIPVDIMINGGRTQFRYVVPQAGRMSMSFNHSIAEITIKPNTKVGTRMQSANIPNTTFVLIPQGSPRCVVQGLDIVVPFDVNALAAAVGQPSKVTHPNGKSYDVTIPPGAKNGAGLRLPKLGLPHVNGAVGNLIAVVNYTVPVLDDDTRAALKKLLEEA